MKKMAKITAKIRSLLNNAMLLQTYVHGYAWRTEGKRVDNNELYVRSFSRRC